MRTYSELISIRDFSDRLSYLELHGKVSEMTFGSNRYLNQMFYSSRDWKQFRRDMIIRDKACDLAHPDHELNSYIYIHHLNPITVDDVINMHSCVLDPENVVCVSFLTHQAIHYGSHDPLTRDLADRKPNDTIPWR